MPKPVQFHRVLEEPVPKPVQFHMVLLRLAVLVLQAEAR